MFESYIQVYCLKHKDLCCFAIYDDHFKSGKYSLSSSCLMTFGDPTESLNDRFHQDCVHCNWVGIIEEAFTKARLHGVPSGALRVHVQDPWRRPDD